VSGSPSRTPAAERLRLDVAQRVHSTAVRLLRLVRLQDAKTGVGPARLSALSVLVFGGPRTLGELAAAEGVKAPTMSRIAEALVESGLVRRRRPAADRRTVRLDATEAGRKLMLAARDRRVGLLAGLLSDLSANELEALAEASRLLAGVLEHRCGRRQGDVGHAHRPVRPVASSFGPRFRLGN